MKMLGLDLDCAFISGDMMKLALLLFSSSFPPEIIGRYQIKNA